jgi:DNA-binding beta-propeller fold protein YncE
VLPQLREIESKYAREVVVIGVESGKYHAERVTPRIRDASIRLDAIHPVLNDRQFRTWRSYAVSAWPTLVAIDPAGYVVGTHAGEFTAEALVSFIDSLIENAKMRGILNTEPLHLGADAPTISSGQLKYPGKVAIEGRRIAIADSANHRVIVATLSDDQVSAKIDLISGTGEAGFVDGRNGQLNSPQGMVFSADNLYIADTENHAVRAVDFKTNELRTIAGTGSQLRTRADRQAGAMSSPWDVTLIGQTLYVAMAGVHQIWLVDIRSGKSRVHSGSGGEDIRDGENQTALLAQPMGIEARGDRLYFADAESSAIRWAEAAEDGVVGTIVGTGLFDFGDVDGKGDDVRLQHAQGLAFRRDGALLVADSYNDCIKIVDTAARTSRAWVRGLNEPSGVACSETHAYVADTNAHRVVAIDFANGEMTELRLE